MTYATRTKLEALHAVPGKALGIWAFVLSSLLTIAAVTTTIAIWA